MKKVKALSPIQDQESDVLRKTGDEWSVKEERAKQLEDMGLVKVIDEPAKKIETKEEKKFD